MHDTYRSLVDTVKRAIKARGLTYKDLVTKVGLPERTLKRILNLEQEDFSRLLAIAEAIGLSSKQLLDMVNEVRDQVFRLAEEQEALLATNPCAWALFYELQRGRELAEIAAVTRLSKATVTRSLRFLEGLGLLERLPGDQVRLKRQGEQSLLIGGPLQRLVFFERQARFAASMMAHLVQGTSGDAHLNMSDHWVTTNTIEKFALKLRTLFKEFRQAAYYDKETAQPEKLRPCRWLSILAEQKSLGEEVLAEFGGS